MIGISIHALREEGDNSRVKIYPNDILFQSTPSVRRATAVDKLALELDAISIHALREEGDYNGKFILDGLRISIHALREEGDV